MQRRGEKKTVLPSRDYTQLKQNEPSDISPLPVPPPRTLPEVKLSPSDYFSQMEIASFEARVQDRVRRLKDDPVAKKAFLKKVDGWIGKAIFAVIFTFAIPPLAGLAITFGLLYLFLMSLKPKDLNRVARIKTIAEDIAVALKLKQGGK